MEGDDDEAQVRVTYPLVMRPLELTCEPVCTTLFAIEDGILLSDPNKQEEDFARTFLLVCTRNATEMCLMRKMGGGFGLSQQQLDLCLSRALENGVHVRKNVYSVLA